MGADSVLGSRGSKMEERPFGKIGVKFPILSFGAQRIVDGHGCSESQAIKIMNHALDRGIRYFDTAWVYSGGQSEERVGKVARHRKRNASDFSERLCPW
jgi:aryl-alcohol dehydrogenase-like predicted oxidoreductase